MTETYEKPVPLRTDTVGDSRMDTMVLLANICLRNPDDFPPTEVLKARDICRLVSTVREKVGLIEVEREAASIARVKSIFQKKRADGYWEELKNLRQWQSSVCDYLNQILDDPGVQAALDALTHKLNAPAREWLTASGTEAVTERSEVLANGPTPQGETPKC